MDPSKADLQHICLKEGTDGHRVQTAMVQFPRRADENGAALVTPLTVWLKEEANEVDLADTFQAFKPSYRLDFHHEGCWGAELDFLLKRARIAIRELKQKRKNAMIICVVVWSGNELVGKGGVEDIQSPLPQQKATITWLCRTKSLSRSSAFQLIAIDMGCVPKVKNM